MKTNFLKSSLLLCGILLFQSCNNDDDSNPVNPEEEITHVILSVGSTDYTYDVENKTLTPANIALFSNQTYNVSIAFQNRSDLNNIEDVTEEVMMEADEHFLVYTTNLTDLIMTRASDDTQRTDGTKIGLKTTWNISSAQSAKQITVRLVHLPTAINATANGNLGSATGGETDAEISFPVSVSVGLSPL